MEWWRLTRTIKGGLEIIEERAKEIISAETRRIVGEKSGKDPDSFLVDKK